VALPRETPSFPAILDIPHTEKSLPLAILQGTGFLLNLDQYRKNVYFMPLRTSFVMQQFLYLFVLPQWQGSLRPGTFAASGLAGSAEKSFFRLFNMGVPCTKKETVSRADSHFQNIEGSEVQRQIIGINQL
jgi:hypothetical protein